MKAFKIGDHVRWDSEAGIVSGTIIKQITADPVLKDIPITLRKTGRSTSSRVTKLITWQFIEAKR